ncbi:SAM-dependent methyltransferase [Psychroflexus maritimus]|uniref:SAM-dependent methyltransferase n=1 Tax=Psychroflexus maritimus TaxID=2714865 RepID=A0A967DZJ4_9FLAO|nr:SAM-dependent methyltransferase [Psychroflexus maritimus]NGZ89572.1 SAM-dependent methyltransferase [Psychroflexus maritimus]
MKENETTKAAGKLYLIPSRLGEQPPLEILPLSIRKIINDINHYIVENEKVSRAFIKKITPTKSQAELEIYTLNKFTQEIEIPEMLAPCLDGIDVGLMSDAGCPGVADPGAKAISAAHKKEIQVVPLVGPSSILLALMASGLNGQNFAFNGYLPIDKAKCKSKIKQLEKRAKQENQSQIIIETPYRNESVLKTLLNSLHPTSYLTLACDLTLSTEYIRTKTIGEWKSTSLPDLHKKPCVFVFHNY